MAPLTNERFFVWLKKKCRKFLLIRTFSIFYFLLNRKHGAIAIDDRTLSVIMELSVFSRSSSIDHLNLCRTWENADTAHRNGNFFFANRLRRDVLEQLYIYNRIEQAYFLKSFLAQLAIMVFWVSMLPRRDWGFYPVEPD